MLDNLKEATQCYALFVGAYNFPSQLTEYRIRDNIRINSKFKQELNWSKKPTNTRLGTILEN